MLQQSYTQEKTLCKIIKKKKTKHTKLVAFHIVLILKVSKKCKLDLHLFFNGQNFQSISDRILTWSGLSYELIEVSIQIFLQIFLVIFYSLAA